MAAHKKNDPDQAVQVCSIDTMRSRNLYPPADLLVIDEAHYCVSESYHQLAEHYPDVNILGVTATPYTRESLRHIADVVVATCSIQTLIDQGYLVRPRYFAPERPDLSGVKTAHGDYVEKDLDEIMGKRKVIGNIVETYRERGENRPALCFCVSLEHSVAMAEAFTWAGISAAHMDAASPDKVRDRVIENSRTGKTKIICNVGVLTTGVDLPWVSCLIAARPTLSLILNIQCLGRGTRAFPGKKDFLIFDHAGNVHYHGFITDHHVPTIDGKESRKMPGDAPVITCEDCFAVVQLGCKVCPECGASFETQKKDRRVLSEDGRLVELDPMERLDVSVQARIMKNKLVAVGIKRGLKRGWVYHNLQKKFGDAVTRAVFPWRASQFLDKKDFD
jgi:superfamily II DNA or RNA helicase